MYGDIANAGEGLQNLGLYSAPLDFEEIEVLFLNDADLQLCHGASVFAVLSDKQLIWSPVVKIKWYWGPNITQIPMGIQNCLQNYMWLKYYCFISIA